MIVKHRDASAEVIQALEIQATRTSDPVKRAACRSAASRLRADPTSGYACDLIDVQCGQSTDWVVLHDLRLRVDGHAIQINHLLISRTLNFFCLDTRFIEYGLDLAKNGQCYIFDRLERKPVASPINKAARDTRKLSELIHHSGLLPRRFGFERRASVKAYVLTNPALRLGISGPLNDGNVGVHTSASVFSRLWKTGFKQPGFIDCRVSSEELFRIGCDLCNLHEPSLSAKLLQSDSLVTAQTRRLLAQAY